MALVSFNGGEAWYPIHPMAPQWTFDTTTFVMDASGEVTALIARAPIAGTIDRFAAIIQAVGNAPDNGLRFSLQGVGATGLNDGTILEATNAFATVASGSVAAGWLDPGAFAASHTVTINELLAFVLDFPSFVAADSVTVRGMSTNNGGQSEQLPYGISVTSTKQLARIPVFVAHYTDSGGFWREISPQIIPATAATTVSIDTGTTPDEIGVVFIPSQPCRLSRVFFLIGSDAPASDFDIVVYDGSNNVLDSVSYDGDQLASPGSSARFALWHKLSTPAELAAGSTYRVILKPTTTANVASQYLSIPDAAISALPGKFTKFYWTSRTNAGAWTDWNTAGAYAYPSGISLGFDQFDDGAGGGGGGVIGNSLIAGAS